MPRLTDLVIEQYEGHKDSYYVSLKHIFVYIKNSFKEKYPRTNQEEDTAP